jgi:hypothetical protein
MLVTFGGGVDLMWARENDKEIAKGMGSLELL